MQIDEVLRIDLPPLELGGAASSDEAVDDAGCGTLGCFVAGPENRLSLLALEQLLTAEADSTVSETALGAWAFPLVLVGPPGSGKSLLVRGIFRRWFPLLGEESAAYCSALDFAREIQTARSEGTLSELRAHLGKLRLFVLEDLQKLPGSVAIQRELRDLWDHYQECGAVVICTAQSAPASLPQLDAGLSDRLAESLLLWLNYPGVAARLELLKLAAAERETAIDERQLRCLADTTSGPAARLMRALNEWELAHVVGSDPGANRTPLSAKEVVGVVARYFGVTQASLKGPARRKSLVFARSVVVYLLRTLSSRSYAEIGRALGNRDHTTIMHAMSSIQESLSSDLQTQKTVEELRRILLAV